MMDAHLLLDRHSSLDDFGDWEIDPLVERQWNETWWDSADVLDAEEFGVTGVGSDPVMTDEEVLALLDEDIPF